MDLRVCDCAALSQKEELCCRSGWFMDIRQVLQGCRSSTACSRRLLSSSFALTATVLVVCVFSAYTYVSNLSEDGHINGLVNNRLAVSRIVNVHDRCWPRRHLPQPGLCVESPSLTPAVGRNCVIARQQRRRSIVDDDVSRRGRTATAQPPAAVSASGFSRLRRWQPSGTADAWSGPPADKLCRHHAAYVGGRTEPPRLAAGAIDERHECISFAA